MTAHCPHTHIVHSFSAEEAVLSRTLRSCCALWARVPEIANGRNVERLFEKELAAAGCAKAAKERCRYHVISAAFLAAPGGAVEDERALVATACSFFKKIRTESGERPVASLHVL